MSKTNVTGETATQIAKRKEAFSGTEEEWKQEICGAKIPHQPPEYDGPDRYCTWGKVSPCADNYYCKWHTGAISNEKRRKGSIFGNMTHGMHATQEHLVEDFDDKDEALYNWVMEKFPDAYDIDTIEDPMADYDLHRLAVEIVRAERGRGFLIREGEVTEKEVRNEDGVVVLDDNGDIVTEKSQHYLADMLYQQDNKITKLEKELGISRKEQLRQDTTDNAVEALTKGFTELGGAFLQREETDYDPEAKPWKNDDDD